MTTKLGLWMQAATKEEREELAKFAGTSVGYLRLLGYGHRENPKVRLALAIEKGTHTIRGKRPKDRDYLFTVDVYSSWGEK